MRVSWNKELGRPEEEKIDDDLDFEAAKSNIHYAIHVVVL